MTDTEIKTPMFTIEGAARRLGMKRSTFEYYLYSGRIKPTAKVGRHPVFSREALDAFKAGATRRNWRGERYYTSTEAADRLGISRQLFSYHLQQGHVRISSISSSGAPLFLGAVLDEFACEHAPTPQGGTRRGEGIDGPVSKTGTENT